MRFLLCKKLLVYLASFILFLVISPSYGWSYDWNINFRNLSQFKEGLNNRDSVPINQYVSAGFSDLPLNLNFQTDFRGYIDASTENDAFDLYQAVFHVEPVSSLLIDGGRYWLPDGFDATLVDGAKFDIAPSSSHIAGEIYAGIPRYIEVGDFHHLTEGLLVGGALRLQNVKDTAARLSVRWKKIDATANNYKENDTINMGLAVSHQFSEWKLSPNIYGNAEYDVAAAKLNVGALGLDFYPHSRAAFTLEGNYFNVNRQANERTLFGAYFNNGIWQGRQAMQIKISKSLHFNEDFSYQHFKAPSLGGENGYKLGTGFDHYYEKIKLSSNAQYYYGKSFGGNVHGGFIEFVKDFPKNWLANMALDVSRYSKITNQKNTAISFVSSLGYSFAKNCQFSLGGEVNHNNWFNREGRVTLNLQMGLEKSDLKPRKL